METRPEPNIHQDQLGDSVSKILTLALALVIFFVPFWQGPDLITEIAPGLIAIMFIVSFMMLGKGAKERVWMIGSPELIGVLFLYFLFCSLSIRWSVIPAFSLEQSFRLWFYFIVFVTVSQGLGIKEIKRLGLIFILTAMIEAFYAIYIFIFTVENFDAASYWVRAMGTFPGPNAFGIYMVMAFLLCLGFVLELEKQGMLFAKFLLSLFLVSLVLTFSRGAVVALLPGLSLFVLKAPDRRKLLKVIGITLIFTVFLGSIVFLTGPEIRIYKEDQGPGLSLEERYTGSVSEAVSLNTRTYLWSDTLDMVIDKPFTGWGLGSFQRVYGIYQGSLAQFPNYAHNQYLQAAAETGIPGVLLLVLFIGLLLRKSLLLVNEHGDNRNYAIGLVAALLSFLVHAAIDFDWDFFALTTTFFVFAGSICGIIKKKFPSTVKSFRLTRVHKVLVALLLMVAVSVYSLATLGAGQTEKGLNNLQKGLFIEARQDFKRAGTLNPLEPLNPIYAGFSYLYDNRNKNEEGFLEKAVAELERAISLDRCNPWLYNQVGHLYWQMGKDGLAEKRLKRSIELYKGDLRYFNDLGAFYAQKGKYAQSEKVLRSGLSTIERGSFVEESEYVRGVEQLSRVLKKQSKGKDARVVIDKALEKFPENPDLLK